MPRIISYGPLEGRSVFKLIEEQAAGERRRVENSWWPPAMGRPGGMMSFCGELARILRRGDAALDLNRQLGIYPVRPTPEPSRPRKASPF